jgi:hypothetical protein
MRLKPILIVASLCLSLPLFAQFSKKKHNKKKKEQKYKRKTRKGDIKCKKKTNQKAKKDLEKK